MFQAMTSQVGGGCGPGLASYSKVRTLGPAGIVGTAGAGTGWSHGAGAQGDR